MSDLEKLIARLRTISTSLMKQAAAAIEQLQAEIGALNADLNNAHMGRNFAAAEVNMIEQELYALIAERDALRAELDLRNKGDPVKRLHNLCDALTEQANESPFTKEQWDQLDAENVSLRAELAAVKQNIDELFPVIAHGDDKHRAWLRDAIEKHFDAARAQAGEK